MSRKNPGVVFLVLFFVTQKNAQLLGSANGHDRYSPCSWGSLIFSNNYLRLINTAWNKSPSLYYRRLQNGTCVKKADVDETCAENDECQGYRADNSVANLLTCIGGKCVCNETVGMKYSQSGPVRCGRKLDQICVHPIHDCVVNATCISGVCTCVPGIYRRTDDNTCLLGQKYAEPCNNKQQCSSRLACSNITNTCECQSGYPLHPTKHICATAANQKCDSRFGDCVPNAVCQCSHKRNNFGQDETCENICKCSDQSQVIPGDGLGYCYIKEGENCHGDLNGNMTDATCLPGLLCVDHRCSCPYKDFQVYNSETRTCQSLLNGPCSFNQDCKDKHSECGTKEGGSVLLCQCKEGYVQGEENNCQVAFGGKCSHKNANDFACDSTYKQLVCSSREICECPSLQIYDPSTRTCKGLVGAKCARQKNPDTFCYEGLYCKDFWTEVSKILGWQKGFRSE